MLQTRNVLALFLQSISKNIYLTKNDEMIRTVLTPENQHISINLPENYIGKKVEVIAFTVEEVANNDTIITDEILTHLASQQVLAKDWLSPEENELWKDL